MIQLIEIFIFFMYLLASYHHWNFSVKPDDSIKWGHLFSLVALLMHGLVLYWLIDRQSAHNLSVINLLSQAAWFAIVVSWLLSWIRWFVPLGMACNIMGAANVFLLAFSPEPQVFISYSLPVLVHVLLSLIVVSIFLLCVMQAVLIFIQNYMMRSKPKIWLKYSWPAIESMEQLLFHMIGIGFMGLTCLIALSFSSLPTDTSMFDQVKVVLVMTSWCVFFGLLMGRFCLGWRGQIAFKWTGSGFGLILAALLLASMRGIS